MFLLVSNEMVRMKLRGWNGLREEREKMDGGALTVAMVTRSKLEPDPAPSK